MVYKMIVLEALLGFLVVYANLFQGVQAGALRGRRRGSI
jgi:hypothetical protein